jgi:hypothetical protein
MHDVCGSPQRSDTLTGTMPDVMGSMHCRGRRAACNVLKVTSKARAITALITLELNLRLTHRTLRCRDDVLATSKARSICWRSWTTRYSPHGLVSKQLHTCSMRVNSMPTYASLFPGPVSCNVCTVQTIYNFNTKKWDQLMISNQTSS